MNVITASLFQKPIGYLTDSNPIWILGFGGLGISLGLAMFGKRVIKTIGSKSSGRMTSSRGFCVEWVAAATVLIASSREIAIPVSTTHCQIGGVIGAGIVKGLVDTKSLVGACRAINLRLLSGILISWAATVPFSISLSAMTFTILRKAIL